MIRDLTPCSSHGTIEVATKDLRPCPIQLRPVRRETLDYIKLQDSIREFGILVPPLIRNLEVVDGAHRLSIANDLKIPSILCIRRQLTDEQVHRIQVQIHASRVQTNPMEYAHRLWRIVELDKTLSLEEVAHSLHQTVDWTRKVLGLVTLCPRAKEALAQGEVSLSAGIELAKVPPEQQEELLSIGSEDLVEVARERARRHRLNLKHARLDRKRRDRDELGPEFRPYKELCHELDHPTNAASVIMACNATTPVQTWTAALKYALSVDPETLEKRRHANARSG